MLDEKQMNSLAGPEETPDDSWWESILSEENRYTKPNSELPPSIRKAISHLQDSRNLTGNTYSNSMMMNRSLWWQ